MQNIRKAKRVKRHTQKPKTALHQMTTLLGQPMQEQMTHFTNSPEQNKGSCSDIVI